MLVLLGMAAAVVDVGKLVVAAQRAQDMADSSALAGATRLPYEDKARTTALHTVLANNDEGLGMPATCSTNDVTFYHPGQTVPGYGELGLYAYSITVTVHVPVEYGFARALGINGAVALRSCTVMRAPAKGVPICTMWIAHTTPLNYGQPMSLLMADGPHYAEIPGSFGFLQSPAGCTATWSELLQGCNLSFEDIETSFVTVGDSLWATTGVDVGLFVKALDRDVNGCGRLERGTSGIYAADTYTDYHADNPRIILIPLVTYIGGTGSNAEFVVERFGAFWLEAVNGGQKTITGRFIDYTLPGGDPNGEAQFDDRIFATSMLQ